MGLSPQLLVTAPRLLLGVGLVAGMLAVWLKLWLLRRIVLRLLGRARRPVGLLGASLTLLFVLLFAATSALALVLCVALASYQSYGTRTPVAELQCIPVSPGKLRLYYVGLGRDQRRGATEIYELLGEQCSEVGQILHFTPALAVLGVTSVGSIHRTEGYVERPAAASAAAPAPAPPATRTSGHDRDGNAGVGWFKVGLDGRKGRLDWLVAERREQAVMQRPDRRAVYQLFITPDGYVTDKHAY